MIKNELLCTWKGVIITHFGRVLHKSHSCGSSRKRCESEHLINTNLNYNGFKINQYKYNNHLNYHELNIITWLSSNYTMILFLNQIKLICYCIIKILNFFVYYFMTKIYLKILIIFIGDTIWKASLKLLS